MPALISRIVISLLFMVMANATAAERRFTVTAPDGVPIAVQESGNPNGPAIIFHSRAAGQPSQLEPANRRPAAATFPAHHL